MEKTYKTGDVVRMLNISRNTIYNWFTRGKIGEVTKDRNKRRIYTEEDVTRIKAFKDRTIPPISL